MDTEYLVKEVGGPLVDAVRAACELRPADPIEFIANHMKAYIATLSQYQTKSVSNKHVKYPLK